jgi:hypothetical protein
MSAGSISGPRPARVEGAAAKVGRDERGEANAFVDGLERASAANRLFGGSNFYGYVARRS